MMSIGRRMDMTPLGERLRLVRMYLQHKSKRFK
jgi:hypothetical protein